ncbi:MAG TPA: LapA family protein [Marmoricola sp.]|jgi:uncharacterized integral membrane protein
MTEEVEPAESRFRPSPKAIGALVVAVLALVFVFQNTAERRVHFWFWYASMPMWVWFLALLAAGVVIGSLFPWLRPRRGES